METENAIWTEKYRPQKFEEVIGQDEIVKRVEAFVKLKNIPHLLFAGPAGTGKSSLSLVIVKTLYGEGWRSNYLELNASDERGIDVVRQKVKGFARTKSFSGPFKIIFLDEADALTKEAQQALRRTMENFTGTCRFILGCNYSSKIIDPIQSRCAVFHFKPLEQKEIERIIKEIAVKESLSISEDALGTLFELSGGDCRRMINILQASATLSKQISKDTLYSVASMAQPKQIKEIIESALRGDFLLAREKVSDLLLKHGLSGTDIIKSMQKEIWNLDIDDAKKVRLMEKCGEIEFRIVEGSDEFIQLEALLASFTLEK